MALQTELHRHLDVSLRLTTLLELAKARDLVAESTGLESFRTQIVLREPLKDLTSVLATFKLFQRVLDRPEVLERVAFEVVEDCYREGTRRVELRFSPSFVGEINGLAWHEILAGFSRGVRRAQTVYPDIQVGLLCIATRDYGPEEVDRTVDFFLENQAQLLGFDLAGNEVGFPCRLFEKSFSRLKKAGAKITVHAGEATGPDNIWEAIDLLGANRVGHGITAIQDPKLMEYLRDKKICLEMCPTSNWLTQATQSLEAHPLPKTLRAGVPVSINTDDPTVFGVNLPHEIRVCREKMRLSTEEIEQILSHAERATFLNH